MPEILRSFDVNMSRRAQRLVDNTERKQRINAMWPILEAGFADTPFKNASIPWIERVDGQDTNPTLSKMQNMVLNLVPYMQDRIDEHYVDHLAYSACLGETIEQELRDKGVNTGYEAGEVAALFLIHDLTTMITGHYGRKDIYFDILWNKLGLRPELRKKLDPVLDIIDAKNKHPRIRRSMPQIVHNYADNLGKFKGNTPRGEDAQTPPLDEQSFTAYINQRLKTFYQNMSSNNIDSPSLYPTTTKGLRRINREGRGAKNLELIKGSIRNLKDKGLDLKQVTEAALQKLDSSKWSTWRDQMKQARLKTMDERKQLKSDWSDQMKQYTSKTREERKLLESDIFNPTISGYLFDVGGTLLDTTDDLLADAIAQKLNVNNEIVREYISQNASQYFDTLDDSAFVFGLYKHLNIEPPSTLEEARLVFINPEIYKPMTGMGDLVTLAIKQGMKIGGFSNCIATLIPVIKEAIKEYYKDFPLENLLFSAEMEMKKQPGDTLPYEAAAEKIEIPPKFCLFFDDNAQYRTDARTAGMLALDPILYPEFKKEDPTASTIAP